MTYIALPLSLNDQGPCFRNCIDATSQCFGCICEVLDVWWPKDAPNCYRKEIVRAMTEKEETNESIDIGVQTNMESEGAKENVVVESSKEKEVLDEQTIKPEVGIWSNLDSPRFNQLICLTFVLLLSIYLFRRFF